ncbi:MULTISPECIES: hypothetical protein [unclassified Chryseobacterium]|uniref:hypothetical protein n=1 Tax=unclassified Chryseobacterium TaxID=2593645 RepID=UPI000D70C865|nr:MULTISPECIES: hypothetical protein [unclassified Chryseobacterium]PWW25665.1 hypothetical protein DEU40_11179 [Chryseobacterium sp. AG844]
MKKYLIIGIIAILCLIIYRYGFLIVFWLTTPKEGTLSSSEKMLLEKIKTENHAKEVLREPKYNVDQPKDTTVYKIIVNKIPCTSDTLMLKNNASSIKKRLDDISLHQNYYKYQIFYECTDGKEYVYSFMRK